MITTASIDRLNKYRKSLKKYNKVYCYGCKKWRWLYISSCLDKKCFECGEEIMLKSELKCHVLENL